jgi:hypothetical protein
MAVDELNWARQGFVYYGESFHLDTQLSLFYFPSEGSFFPKWIKDPLVDLFSRSSGKDRPNALAEGTFKGNGVRCSNSPATARHVYTLYESLCEYRGYEYQGRMKWGSIRNCSKSLQQLRSRLVLNSTRYRLRAFALA